VSWFIKTIVSLLAAGAAAGLSSVFGLLHAERHPASIAAKAIFEKKEAVIFILVINFGLPPGRQGSFILFKSKKILTKIRFRLKYPNLMCRCIQVPVLGVYISDVQVCLGANIMENYGILLVNTGDIIACNGHHLPA
jgi:hypothetical protein